MTITPARSLASLALVCLLAAGVGGAAAPSPAPAQASSGAAATEVPPPQDVEEIKAEDEPLDPAAELVKQVNALLEQLTDLRQRLARAELEASEARREAQDLRQYIEDHDEYGADFERYREIIEIREREARLQELERRRAERQAEHEARQRELDAARASASEIRAERARQRELAAAGFEPVGGQVYVGNMAYAYFTERGSVPEYEYEPLIGRFLEVHPYEEVDYSRMRISGSVINGAADTRNLGVAVVFFDNQGNQVGHEIVQVANARPDVPYPFTSTVEMALNRPFASASTYVLYADLITAGNDAAETGQSPGDEN